MVDTLSLIAAFERLIDARAKGAAPAYIEQVIVELERALDAYVDERIANAKKADSRG